jgi:hypothetical protein
LDNASLLVKVDVMLPLRIKGHTRVMFGENCFDLAIRDVITPHGPVMVSAWEMTPKERQSVANGASVTFYCYLSATESIIAQSRRLTDEEILSILHDGTLLALLPGDKFPPIRLAVGEHVKSPYAYFAEFTILRRVDG